MTICFQCSAIEKFPITSSTQQTSDQDNTSQECNVLKEADTGEVDTNLNTSVTKHKPKVEGLGQG